MCSYAAAEESRILGLTELLEQKAHSPFYQEGVSNALLKMAELGLTRAAAVLLQSGANLNFEGQRDPRGARARPLGLASVFPPVYGVTSPLLLGFLVSLNTSTPTEGSCFCHVIVWPNSPRFQINPAPVMMKLH